MSLNDLKITKNKFYFAHRGAPWIEKENTIPSVVKAIDLGCDGIEIDVRRTKDNKIIIFHDDYIIFHNLHCKVSKLTYSQIKQIMKENQRPQPALFNYILPIIKKNPSIIFNIEIKSKDINNHFIINYIKKELIDNKILNQCIISSFNYLLLLQIRWKFKSVSLGLIMGRKRLAQKTQWINILLIKILRPQFIHANGEFLSDKLLRWLRKNEFGISVYTINTKNILKKMIERGLLVFFTDNHTFYSNKTSKD